MASASETGHIRNLTAFDSLNTGTISIGPTYAPSNDAIKPTALAATLATATILNTKLKDATTPYRAAIKARQTAFDPLGNLAGRVVGIFETSDTPANARERLRALAYFIQGKNASGRSASNSTTNPDGSETDGTSSSQMSFDRRLANFNEMLAILAEYPGYAPAEAAFKLSTLTALAATLHATNQAVITTSKPYAITLANRNNFFYTPETGLTDIGRKAKKYILKAFGPKSPEYAAVKTARFTNPRNK